MSGNLAASAAASGPHLGFDPPVADRDMLVRGRLLEPLRQRWSLPVTVVSASAGYGKTTLLAQAVAANATAPVGIDCWLTCGPELAAASRLGEALWLAVEAEPGADTAAPSAHRGPDSRAPEPKDLARAVGDALWRYSPRQVALILDDVHEIPEGSDAAHLLDEVVGRLPANAHVVLAGRWAPPVSLARLEVAGKVLVLHQDDLAFAREELAAFADLRGVPETRVSRSGGWPALAELQASARSSRADDYVAQEVLGDLPEVRRRHLALLAHLGPVDDTVAAAALDTPVHLPDLLGGVPMVSQVVEGEWSLHSLWRSMLEPEVTGEEVAEAQRRAGVELREQGRFEPAMRLLTAAGDVAEGDVATTIVEALGFVHAPVAQDVLVGWLAALSGEVRDRPAGQLLAGVVASEWDPDGARRSFLAAADAFRDRGERAGELACLVQLGQMAWWADDAEGLAAMAKRNFELEADGFAMAEPLACLGRALLHDIANNDSRQMLAELDRIGPGSLNTAWWGIVCWARAIALLELGLTDEARTVADEALAHGQLLHAPLAQTTRLQALWYQGRTSEVPAALLDLLRSVQNSGYRNHAALVASDCSRVHALLGQISEAQVALAEAKAAARVVAGALLVDVNLAAAEAAVAVAIGDEATAAAVLADDADRRPVGEGVTAAAQQRHLAMYYVLVPETRPYWDRADLGPAWAVGRDLARAVVAVRDGRGLPAGRPPLDQAGPVQAHLPPHWVAELGVAAVAAGRRDGWDLLEQTWAVTRPVVAELAKRSKGASGRAAKATLGQLSMPPERPLRLRMLGPLELESVGMPVPAPEWRRERVRTLLTYLVLHGTVSRERLADDLWPGLDADAQSRNLRVTLTYLLRVLEPQRAQRDASYFVRQRGDTVALYPGDWLSVDLWDFDAHCRAASDADRRGDPAGTLEHALQATELWRGEPGEVAYEDWARVPLEQRRQSFVAMAARAGELLLARGEADQEQALALGARALEVDPWLEAAHRLTVAAHQAGGDNLAARRALRRYREAAQELGVSPGEATLMVERLIESLPSGPGPDR